ncbi:hypothetical protein [Flavisolibacter tropicus]|uniref:Uncharacterized protein n=1 Tax=Flavisolibacter tropicus TaxID=1492898 RepID=A0A172U183_9BACT|nr:hypothetical protein [Flavisolibacter tropicus]ANE52982.1 hypothetical protein SY85_23405 [Flavisolibacter tropicus]
MKTTLQFSSLLLLTGFQSEIKMRSYRINTSDFTLAGVFSEAEIELAEESYKALSVHSEAPMQKVA